MPNSRSGNSNCRQWWSPLSDADGSGRAPFTPSCNSASRREQGDGDAVDQMGHDHYQRATSPGLTRRREEPERGHQPKVIDHSGGGVRYRPSRRAATTTSVIGTVASAPAANPVPIQPIL